ncbi:MAG: bifunctional tRNA (5-methylaminomethyl-2-thiouridine)(34)-methyltransferase MnmD/FAD-dependent 5-carboxymethylaminomethyl-2-thiouridine(34) oxidoreductase MnmC [Psychromonas sp.]|nr:bifunctional tRNA (5-methylaminomethyl-2-thiouridine)(34)-methyltransferase MnmD/FAD-dependent 5-carboxymethylaminomethyl-2-thiouridine(34) oxidoreductase MnmC [Psychromonas sp.]
MILTELNEHPVEFANIKWVEDKVPYSSQFDDVYFNTNKGKNESVYTFIEGNNLYQRWHDHPTRIFSIAETGFGTGLNFLVTCDAFSQHLQQQNNPILEHLFFTSFEKYPLTKNDIILAINQWPSLLPFLKILIAQYPINLVGCHRIHFDAFNITLDLWFGDAYHSLQNLHVYKDGLFDAWYLDGFTPYKNPDMWQQPLFNLMGSCSKQGATIATFSVANMIKKGLQNAGITIKKRKGFGKKREMLTGIIAHKINSTPLKHNVRNSATYKSNEIAIIGGGISAACLTLALVKRGFCVNVYCKDEKIARGASGIKQATLYPLINNSHNSLSQFFANAFLYSHNLIDITNKTHPFDYDLSGLLQLYYDLASSKKLDKIHKSHFSKALVQKTSARKTNIIAGLDVDLEALFYPSSGWVNPIQMVNAIFDKAKEIGSVTIKLNTKIDNFKAIDDCWELHCENERYKSPIVILATAMETLTFKDCEAIPLSAARGQVTHIQSTPNSQLNQLKVPLCHEGYLTPQRHNIHCMGATFERHQLNSVFKITDQKLNKEKLNKCITNKRWAKAINCDHNFANIGIRCTTRDHFPYMGELADYQRTKIQYQHADKHFPQQDAPFHKNMFILTGLGSRGLCSAPLLAETLVSQILHEPLPLSSSILSSLQVNRQWINYLLKSKPLAY